jgi:hypothetical protein
VERIDESCGEKMIFLLTSQCGIRIASFTGCGIAMINLLL